MPERVAGCDCAIRFDDGFEFGEAVESGVWPGMLVGVKNFRVAFFSRDRDRDNFILEEAS